MRISRWKLFCGLVILCCTSAAPAAADVHLAFGTRWQPLRYTTAAYPISADGNMSFDSLKAPVGLSGFQSTSLDPYLALFLAQKYGIVLALDIGYGAMAYEKTPMMGTATNQQQSYLHFGFSLGFKWYITQPKKDKVSPYLQVDFYKYFASLTTNADGTNTSEISFLASLLSPIGGTLAFGAEYFVSPGFSVGADIFGLRVANVSGEFTQAMTTEADNGTRYHRAYTYVTFFTAISLNYRFQVQASVRAIEEEAVDEEQAPANKKKKKKGGQAKQPDDEQPAAPVAPPAPTPEAID